MAQHDYSLANQSGASFRTDLNNALSAIVSNNSGATEPTTTFAYQWWADTTTGILKQRNAANSAWVSILTLSTGVPIASILDTTRINVASAATVNLTSSAPDTRHINITGTTNITAFTVAVGKVYFVRFNAALTLTNNASIVTQTGANITTSAGDTCMLRATAANTVEVLFYSPAAGGFAASETSAGISELATTAEFQTGTDTLRVPPVAALRSGLQVIGTFSAWTSGTTKDFTGIPSWATEVKFHFQSISTDGTSDILMRLGDSGGFENSGYVGACSFLRISVTTAESATGWTIRNNGAAADVLSGTITISRASTAANDWTMAGTLSGTSGASPTSWAFSGYKQLSAALTQVRFLTSNGADTGDSGSISMSYR